MQASPDSRGRALPVYLVMTLALSSIFYYLIIRAGHLNAGHGLYVLGLMWCPGISAMLTCVVTGRRFSSLGWRWPSWRNTAAAYFIPLAYAAVAYGIVWLTGLGHLYDAKLVASIARRLGGANVSPAAGIALFFLTSATLGMIPNCISALGEEIGWRGFLVPELASRMSFTRAALISGCVWSVWHYPILIFADYNAGTPVWYGLTCFTVMVISISFVFAWLRLKSGSLWTGMLLHASHNLFIQGFFDPMTGDTGPTKYIIGEFGAALALTTMAFAAYFWGKRRELAPESPALTLCSEPASVRKSRSTSGGTS